MLAVVELSGNQFIVREWDIIDVKKLDQEVDSEFTMEAMLVSDEEWNSVKVGAPVVEGSKITLKVLDQYKWEKVRVFKMKPKSRYSRNKWFRARLTKLEVVSIA